MRHGMLLSRKTLGQRMVAVSVGLWTIIVAVSVYLAVLSEREHTYETALTIARIEFQKDQIIRQWATRHGGVYVSVNKRTPPNEYLTGIPERDVETTSGKKLTLMNPAYIIRQMRDEFRGIYGLRGHITSLQLLRPENKPDGWEIKALQRLSSAYPEYYEFIDMEGLPTIRYMGAMITTVGCLKCHGHQGYEVGDVRGGVSVTMSLEGLLSKENTGRQIFIYTFVWLSGMIIILVFGQRQMRNGQKLDEAREELALLNRDLELKVREETERRLRHEKTILEQSKHASMGQMISAIAHQWKQPLNTIGVLVQGLEDAAEYNECNNDMIRETSEECMRQLMYMGKTITDFRNFFKPGRDAGDFLVGDVIRSVVSLVLAQLRSSRIKLNVTCECDGETCEKVNADTLHEAECLKIHISGYSNDLQQVLVNLINNARDAVVARQLEGSLVDGLIHIQVKKDASQVRIIVSDNGGGIPEEYMPHIFEEYFSTKGDEGTGLGLSMAKMIMQQHLNGDIAVVNGADGAQFVLVLPAGEREPDEVKLVDFLPKDEK